LRYIRRIQYTGKSTFIVSLPKKWVLAQGLTPGSEVVVEENGPFIVIKPFSRAENKPQKTASIVIKGDEDPEAVARRIIGAYIMNYDKIIVKSSTFISPAIRNTVRNTILNKLPGTEIINEDKHEIHVQVVLNSRNITIGDALKRLFKVVYSVIEDACTVLEKKDMSIAQEVIKEDESVDRIYFYIIRLLNLAGSGAQEVEEGVSSMDLLIYRSLAKLLERIGDHAVNIAKNSLNLLGSSVYTGNVCNLCRESLEIYRNAVEAVASRNPFVVEDVVLKVSALSRSEEQLFSSYLNTLQPDQLVALRLILESIRRIAEYSRDMSELALDLGLEKVLEKPQQ
jgi:phosphate uptake regulator